MLQTLDLAAGCSPPPAQKHIGRWQAMGLDGLQDGGTADVLKGLLEPGAVFSSLLPCAPAPAGGGFWQRWPSLGLSSPCLA